MIPVKKTAKRPNLGIFGLMAYKLRKKKDDLFTKSGTRKDVEKVPK